MKKLMAATLAAALVLGSSSMAFAAETEDNNTWTTADALSGSQAGVIANGADVDYWKLAIPSGFKTVSLVNAAGDADMEIFEYKNGQLISLGNWDYVGDDEATLLAGTYYVKVYSGDYAEYTISAN